MNTPNPSDLDRVLEKINEIAKGSAAGDYIYRGEPEQYEKVSSNLYRESPHTDRINFDIVRAQEAILEEAKAYIGKTDDIDETDDIGILTQFQHFGGKTNLIDFTEDYLIAIFFACDGSHEEDGRVILLKRKSKTYKVRKPRRTSNRVESQKSIFVESPDGFVTPDIEVTIPAALKFPILEYLQKHHRISIETIYNDLPGFIRHRAYTESLRGLTYLRKANETKTHKEKLEHYENAIKHYTEALKLKPNYQQAYYNRGNAYAEKGDFDAAIQDYNTVIDLNSEDIYAYNNRGNAYADKGDFDAAIQDYNTIIDLNSEIAEAYVNRGTVYTEKGDFDAAIEDFNTAIDLNSEIAEIYVNRGEVWLHLKEWERAEADLMTAKNKGADIVDAFRNDYESVENFEAKNGVKVPEDIAALLRRQ